MVWRAIEAELKQQVFGTGLGRESAVSGSEWLKAKIQFTDLDRRRSSAGPCKQRRTVLRSQKQSGKMNECRKAVLKGEVGSRDGGGENLAG